MVQGNYTSSRNKHTNIMIRKKWRLIKGRRTDKYICCYGVMGNCNKINYGYCCTWPQLYNRLNNHVFNNWLATDHIEDFVVN